MSCILTFPTFSSHLQYTATPSLSQKQNENRRKKSMYSQETRREKKKKSPAKRKPNLKETLAPLQKQNKNTKEKGVNSRFRAGNVIQSG